MLSKLGSAAGMIVKDIDQNLTNAKAGSTPAVAGHFPVKEAHDRARPKDSAGHSPDSPSEAKKGGQPKGTPKPFLGLQILKNGEPPGLIGSMVI